MNVRTISQPESQLGVEIDQLLHGDTTYSRIIFVSAFTALNTILRLRERLLEQMANKACLRFTVGIDLGGTSREVLYELLRWNCETFVFHNTIVRATFHPKVYLFQSDTNAILFIGSNNLTDGGFFTNYEAATRYEFELPADLAEYERIVKPLAPFLEPNGATVQQLNSALIETLVARGELPSEAETRRRRRARKESSPPEGEGIPESPFAPVTVPLPPLLPKALRREDPERSTPRPHVRAEERQEPPLPGQRSSQPQPAVPLRPAGILIWRKRLPQTDALQVNPGSHHVGGVRLTQARFENPAGQRIDQTTYFRQIFTDYLWEREPGRHADQEHTVVPMRVIIRGRDFGIRNFEISHKPSGEAGQANYTTILRWGREFSPVILQENLTNTVFSLYETAERDADFLIEITDP